MTNSGYEQFVAKDVAQFVDLAVAWAGRITELAAIRSQMRDNVSRSPLCDAPTFARDLLFLFYRAWNDRLSQTADPTQAPLG